MNIPIKVTERITEGLKKFQPILKNLKAKDINESDTVSVVNDVLGEIFGFDKYTEVTSEYAINKTFCDLAIKIDGDVKFLIEVKSINSDLNNHHIKQASDYGSNAGVDWVILTNGVNWKVFKIIFSKPVYNELVYEFNLMEMSSKKTSDIECLFMVSKESLSKSVLMDFHVKKTALNKFAIGNLLATDYVIDFIRKTIKRINPEIKVENENIKEVLVNEVLKRELFEGNHADAAKKKINKFFKDLELKKSDKE